MNYSVRGNETSKVAKRVAKYCKGMGLDLGCGNVKVSDNAIGVDFEKWAAASSITLDLSKPNALKMFADKMFDFVFSSHLLEDFPNTKDILKEWSRVIKVGGYIILYGPDKSIYPHIGEPGCSPHHKVDLGVEDIKKILISLGYQIVSACIRDRYKRWTENEYSFEVVGRKK